MPDLFIALAHYLTFVLMDGDYLNDWLRHCPAQFAASLMTLGKLISQMPKG
jgi:hypothetical protein